MKEKNLYSYWEQHVTEDGPFETEQGEQLTVISPGRRNAGSGPDFNGCILDVNGEIHTGDVEIHVHEGDWYQHEHEKDEAFDRVKLHFFLFPDSDRIAADQVERTVQINDLPSSSTGKGSSKHNLKTTRTLCPAGHKLKQFPDRTRNVLLQIEQLGRNRIQRRAEFIQKQIQESQDRGNVLARILCECTCLRCNRSPAKELSRHLSFHRLKRQLRNYRDGKNAQLYGEGILFQKAGLLLHTQGLEDPEWNVYCSKIESFGIDKGPVIAPETWDFSDVRPVNTPYRRLAGFVALFRRLLVDFSIEQLERILLDQVEETGLSDGLAKMSGASDLLSFFIVRPDQVHSYWNEHSCPGDRFDRPMGLIGTHRAGIIWINGILPYLIALTRRRNRSGLKERLWDICRNGQLPLGDRRSEKVSSMLFGTESSTVPSTALMDQGQHELYKSFCRFGPNGCSRCPVRDKLNRMDDTQKEPS